MERSFQSYLNNNNNNNNKLNPNNTVSHYQEIAAKLGSTGSRLLSGNAALPRFVEANLTDVHNRPDALLCNSGYDTNLSILSYIPIYGDFVIMDELVHNSLVMGVRMSRVNKGDVIIFRHNDVGYLETKLLHLSCRKEERQDALVSREGVSSSSVIIVVESVYSMDGDIAPLAAILMVASDFGTNVIVDEAHGLGVYGTSNPRDLILPEHRSIPPPPRQRKETSTGITTVTNDETQKKGVDWASSQHSGYKTIPQSLRWYIPLEKRPAVTEQSF